LKLNELVAAIEGASNRLINVEDLTEEEVRTLHEHYCKLVELAKQDVKLTESHSIEDAEQDHARKLAARKAGRTGARRRRRRKTAPDRPGPASSPSDAGSG